MKKAVYVFVLAALMTSAASAGNWWETIKVKGDLRYRHEMIKEDDADARNRHRLRARFGLFGDVSDNTKIGIQLATGSSDPVSTNQTLTGGFSSKSIVLDMAYFEMTNNKLPGFTLIGGKFHNPFFKAGSSELIWDSDWNPEGGTLHYDKDFTNGSLQLTGAGLWIEERSKDKNSYLTAGQGVLKFDLNEKKSSIALGGSYFYYGNAKEYAPFYDDGDAMGNTTMEMVDGSDTTTVYANGYELFEAFGQFTHHFDNIPVTVMGDFVSNSAADSLNSGWLVGFEIGKAKKVGSWALRYCYRNVEKDAVVGMYADSDFRGGGTDAKGHEIGGSVVLSENTVFSVSYFDNKIGLEAPTQEDFKRLQVDLQLKFK
ncbi:MAG: putative porin [Candidatus Zixiibacteriota bacterium]